MIFILTHTAFLFMLMWVYIIQVDNHPLSNTGLISVIHTYIQ